MVKSWLNHQNKFRQMTYFQQSAKISSRQNFRLYGIRMYYDIRMHISHESCIYILGHACGSSKLVTCTVTYMQKVNGERYTPCTIMRILSVLHRHSGKETKYLSPTASPPSLPSPLFPPQPITLFSNSRLTHRLRSMVQLGTPSIRG